MSLVVTSHPEVNFNQWIYGLIGSSGQWKLNMIMCLETEAILMVRGYQSRQYNICVYNGKAEQIYVAMLEETTSVA